jgi:hypothetical protein
MTKGIYFLFLSFAFIAAMMAYLISYNEWIHHYPTKKEPRKIALETAIFTFVVFGVIIFIVIQMLV